MTNPDFAELKEKFEKFDNVAAWNAANLVFKPDRPHQEWHQLGAKYQHTKDAAIITELLEIIKSQNEALEFISKTDTSENAPDFIWLHNWRNTTKQLAQNWLSETNTRLQKLGEEVND